MPKPNEHQGRNAAGHKAVRDRILSHRELMSLLRAQGCIEVVPDLRSTSSGSMSKKRSNAAGGFGGL